MFFPGACKGHLFDSGRTNTNDVDLNRDFPSWDYLGFAKYPEGGKRYDPALFNATLIFQGDDLKLYDFALVKRESQNLRFQILRPATGDSGGDEMDPR